MKFPSKITVAALDVRPFFHFVKDGKPKGAEGNLLRILSQALKFDYRIVVPPEREWGIRTPNGTWTGLIKMVQTGKADMGMCTLSYTEERHSVVDYSFPTYFETITFATDLPKPVSKEKIYVNAFDVMSWISIFLLLLLLPLAFKLMRGPKSSYIDQFLTVFGNILHQPTPDDVFVGRFVMVCWWFVSLILSASFSAGLSSIMTVPATESVPQDYRQLAVAVESGSHTAYSMKGTATFPAMRNNTQPYIIKIADNIEKNDLFMPAADYVKEFKPGAAMVGNKLMLSYWYGKPPLSTKHISEDESLPLRIAITFGKNFCCRNRLNRVLLKVLGGGIYEKLLNNEFFMSWLKLPKEGMEMKSYTLPLTLNDVSGAFILLLFGYVVSFVVFLGELAHTNLKK